MTKVCTFCFQEYTYVYGETRRNFCTACLPSGDEQARHRLYTYNLPNFRYLEMKAALTDGLCPICNLWEATSIDHDHSCCGSARKKETRRGCGECVRGLICAGCNLNIEYYERGLIQMLPDPALRYLGS